MFIFNFSLKMPIILAHRIRLNLNNVQRSWFYRCAGAARFAFNWGLATWNRLHEAGQKVSWQALNALFNSLKTADLQWTRNLPWFIFNQALQDLGAAFSNFFRRVRDGAKPGYPKFKKKGKVTPAFSIEARRIVFDGKRLRIPKIGWVRLCTVLRFPGKVMSCRFSEHAGHWYCSVQVEVDEAKWIYPHGCETQATVGMDLGVVDLAVLSTGEHVPAPRILRQQEAKIRKLNKELSRRCKGGRNWTKTKDRLGRVHESIANIRKDVTHNLTAKVVRKFRWIGIEDLCIKAMAKTGLAKSVLDAAMYEVVRQLQYKSELAGSVVVKADRFYPSSKTCSSCGVVLEELPLGVRTWVCGCGAQHDRDENAAKNLEKMAAAHAVTACCQGSAGVSRDTKLSLGQESGSYVD